MPPYAVFLAAGAGRLLHGLSDRSRLALVEQLAGGGRRVSDLVDATGLREAA